MEEKKVRKSRKGAAKTKMSPMIEVLGKQHKEPLELHFNISDKDFTVLVKQHINYSARSAIIPRVEDMFFPEGIYDPMYGESLLEFIIMQIYTDLDFNNDFNVFDAFKYEHGDIYTEIKINLPHEVSDLHRSVHDMVNALIDAHNIPEQQKVFYDNAVSLCVGLKGVSDSLIGVLNSAQESLHGVNQEDMKELISAMSFAGKVDESKVAKAVLDFQREKEKRVAVKAERDANVPHI